MPTSDLSRRQANGASKMLTLHFVVAALSAVFMHGAQASQVSTEEQQSRAAMAMADAFSNVQLTRRELVAFCSVASVALRVIGGEGAAPIDKRILETPHKFKPLTSSVECDGKTIKLSDGQGSKLQSFSMSSDGKLLIVLGSLNEGDIGVSGRCLFRNNTTKWIFAACTRTSDVTY